jgi:hypothetical protein
MALAKCRLRTKKVSDGGRPIRHLYTDIEARRRTQQEEQETEVEAAQTIRKTKTTTAPLTRDRIRDNNKNPCKTPPRAGFFLP